MYHVTFSDIKGLGAASKTVADSLPTIRKLVFDNPLRHVIPPSWLVTLIAALYLVEITLFLHVLALP